MKRIKILWNDFWFYLFEVENKSAKLKTWKNSFRCKQPDRDNQNNKGESRIKSIENNNNSQAKNPDSDPSVLRGVEMRF